jgi:hypothetical protein
VIDEYYNLPDPAPDGTETRDEFLNFFREINVERLESLSRKETVTYRRFFNDFRQSMSEMCEAYRLFG